MISMSLFFFLRLLPLLFFFFSSATYRQLRHIIDSERLVLFIIKMFQSVLRMYKKLQCLFFSFPDIEKYIMYRPWFPEILNNRSKQCRGVGGGGKKVELYTAIGKHQ